MGAATTGKGAIRSYISATPVTRAVNGTSRNFTMPGEDLPISASFPLLKVATQAFNLYFYYYQLIHYAKGAFKNIRHRHEIGTLVCKDYSQQVALMIFVKKTILIYADKQQTSQFHIYCDILQSAVDS